MHVHYVALQDLSEPTGASAHVIGAVRGLQANGADVSVTAVAPPDFAGPGDTFHALPPFRDAGGLVSQLLGMRRTTQEAVAHLRSALADCDIAYTRHYLAAGLFARAGCPVPWVFELNGLAAHERAARGGLMNRALAARIDSELRRTLHTANHVVTVTPELRTTVTDLYGVPAGRITAVLNGIDAEMYRPQPDARAAQREAWGIPDDAPLVGYVGNCGPWQRFDVLADALVALRAGRPGLRAVVVGGGVSRPAWEHTVNVRGLQDMVRFTGAVPPAEAARALAALDVALNLHHQGALSGAVGTAALKVRAACACGVPIVVLRTPGAAFLEREGLGRVVDPSGAALAAALDMLFGDADERRRMGGRGVEYARAHFGWDQVGRKLLAVCERVLGRP